MFPAYVLCMGSSYTLIAKDNERLFCGVAEQTGSIVRRKWLIVECGSSYSGFEVIMSLGYRRDSTAGRADENNVRG
jgi:hypothetical protein